MPTNNPGDKARARLLALEKRRHAAVISEFQKIQVRLMSEISDLLERIEKQRRFEGNASPGLLIRKARLTQLLDAVTDEIRTTSARLAKLTESAQTAAIDVAQTQAGQYPQIVTDLNFFDGPATRELIGIAGNGQPLAKHFAKLAKPLRQAMFDALFYGLAAGRSNESIAKEIRDAIGGTTAAAMTIVRTETNRAYREASRQFYAETPDVVGWRWLSALDLRTCPICWALHGRVFKTKTKFGTHPNCRCTMVPVFAGDPRAITGPEVFAGLNDAQRRAILGPKRLELYLQGAELSDFVENYKSPFGIGRRIKPLARTTFKPNPRDPKPPSLPTTPRPSVTPPTPALPPATTPFSASTLRKQFTTAAIARRKGFIDRSDELRENLKEQQKRWSAAYLLQDKAELDRILPELNAARAAVDANNAKLAELVIADRATLAAPNPIRIQLDLMNRTSFPKSKPDRKDRVVETVEDYNKLIDAAGWPSDRKRITVKHSTRRAYYAHWDRAIYVNTDSDGERRTIVHEISHSLEMTNAENLRQANDFLNYRTEGEKPVKLSKVTGQRGYGRDEVTRPDKFKHPYVGKQYGTLYNQDATEVISMGVESLYAEPFKFALDDPEYFEFILHIVRGEKWSRPK